MNYTISNNNAQNPLCRSLHKDYEEYHTTVALKPLVHPASLATSLGIMLARPGPLPCSHGLADPSRQEHVLCAQLVHRWPAPRHLVEFIAQGIHRLLHASLEPLADVLECPHVSGRRSCESKFGPIPAYGRTLEQSTHGIVGAHLVQDCIYFERQLLRQATRLNQAGVDVVVHHVPAVACLAHGRVSV